MKRLLLALTIGTAVLSAACGGGGGTTVLPPPQGGFGPSSLNGTYSFVTNGEVFNGQVASSFSRAGSFVANGAGGITGGVEDAFTSGVGVNAAITITGGSYSISSDGRGSISLSVTCNGAPSSITFGITLTSKSGGLMIDETANSCQESTGSGNFVLQNTALFNLSTVNGTYVFDFSGFDPNQGPESIVGQFAVSNNTISTGVEDIDDSGTLTTAQTVSGNFSADGAFPATLTSAGRGIANINGVEYIFYIVNANQLRFLAFTSGAMLSGDAILQVKPPTTLNAGLAFVVAGSSANGGLIRTGRFTANGTGVTNALVDTNDSGKFTQTTQAAPSNASITFDAVNPGRVTVTFKDPNLSTPYSFVVYFSSATQGVIQETTQANGLAAAVADGTIAVQTGNPFSSSNITGTYAMNWSGQSLQNGVRDEEDVVGQATVSNLALTGAADIFQFQSVNGPQPDNVVGGSILFNGGDGTGGDTKRNTMTVTLTNSGRSTTVDFVVYFVNPQLAFFSNTSTSSTRIVAGVLQAQQ